MTAIDFLAADNINHTPVSAANPLPVSSGGGNLPATATAVSVSSGNQANANAVATMAAVAAKTNYITGFQITASGATSAGVVNATVVGLLGGTATYTFTVPAGATTAAQPLQVTFANPMPASAVNTAIVVTLPALGSGNTNAAVNAQGYVL